MQIGPIVAAILFFWVFGLAAILLTGYTVIVCYRFIRDMKKEQAKDDVIQ